MVLKRLDDAVRDGDSILAVIRGVAAGTGDGLAEACREAGVDPAAVEAIPDAADDVGWAGAAAGVAALVKAVLCLHRQILPPKDDRAASYWLRDRMDGPRRGAVGSSDVDGGRVDVVLEEWEPAATADHADRRQPLDARDEALFVVEGRDSDRAGS